MEVFPRYPLAEWRSWKSGYRYQDAMGLGKPAIATVQHVLAGFLWTGWDWPENPPRNISWHFTVKRNGDVMQHLPLQDGGWHTGVSDKQTKIHPPTWPLWKGLGLNVNKYTIGIEAEGVPYNDSVSNFTKEQMDSLRLLHRWIADTCRYTLSEQTIVAHAEIDVVNRVNDWDYPGERYLLKEYVLNSDNEDLGNAIAFLEGVAGAQQVQLDTLNRYLRMRMTISEIANAVTPENEAFMMQVYDYIVAQRAGGRA